MESAVESAHLLIQEEALAISHGDSLSGSYSSLVFEQKQQQLQSNATTEQNMVTGTTTTYQRFDKVEEMDDSDDDQSSEQESPIFSHDTDSEGEPTELVPQDLLPMESIPKRPEHPTDYTFAWSVATQKGYRYANNFSRDRRLDIHVEMEDRHFPSYSDSPNFVHKLTGRPFQLFILADGHGGHKCAQYVVESMPGAIIDIINGHAWDLYQREDQERLRTEIQHVFLETDREYCRRKFEEFRQCVMGRETPIDFRDKSQRPPDDGCTVVLNILYDGFLVNCNLGDSRTLLLQRDAEEDRWTPCFASIDHTPGHPHKAQLIHQNGGRFIINNTTAIVHDIISTLSGHEPHQPHEFLSRCRIGRPHGWRITELDVPACTTLNLAGTMGDLFFKYNPPLITAAPDVSFHHLQLTPEQEQSDQQPAYLLIMASDGLWDHMCHQEPNVQHSLVTQYVDNTMRHADIDSLGFLVQQEPISDDGHASSNSTTTTTPPSDSMMKSEHTPSNQVSNEVQRKLQKLGILAHGLCDREMLTCDSRLFMRDYVRYDDVTAFAVLIEPTLPTHDGHQ